MGQEPSVGNNTAHIIGRLKSVCIWHLILIALKAYIVMYRTCNAEKWMQVPFGAFIIKMVSTKVRRHSGRYWPTPTDVGEDNVYIQEEYDDWLNYRDSMRSGRYECDGKNIVAKSMSNRFKFPMTHSMRNWVTNELTEYTDDGFAKLYKINLKNIKHNLIRKLKKQSLRHT
jgi:hypothetical protein